MRQVFFPFILLAAIAGHASAQTEEVIWSQAPWILTKAPDTFFNFGFGCHLVLPSADASLHIFIWVNAAEIVVYDPQLDLPESSGSMTVRVPDTDKSFTNWPSEYGGTFGRTHPGSMFLLESLRDLIVDDPAILEVVMPDDNIIGTFVAPQLSVALDNTEKCVEKIQW